jgi:serine phosphatase RsbU (regulator of sigma subunit)
MTGLARHTIRAAAWQGAAPDEVLRQLNNAILRSGRETFCTALYCTVVPTERGFDFEVAAGGHPLPIVYRDGERARTVGRTGTLLGLIAEAESRTDTTTLSPGDTVVLYTDGATDVRPPHGLTTEALEGLVELAAIDASGAAEVADRLGHQLSAILPISERNDDIALLVLKITRR